MAVRFLDEAPPRKVRARFLDEEPDVAPELPQDIPIEDASIAPAPEMSEEATLSAGLSGSNMPPVAQPPTLSEQDPRFPEVQAGVSGANALLEQTLLPTRLDWRNSLPVQEIRQQAAVASAEAELARREVATIDPLNFPAIQEARERRDVLLNRAEPMQAYAEQVRPRTGFEQQEIEAAKVVQQNEQFRRELNERGDAPGLLETANSKFWSKASDLAAGVLRQGAPETAQALSQFGAEAGEMAGINTGARGKIGRGAGEVGFLAATMGRGGLPGIAAGTLAGAVATREQVLRETGSPTEADKAALESYPALALYMLTGSLAAKGAAALVPENASKLTKGLAGFAGAEIGNVVPSVVIRALNNQDYDLESFTADTLFAAYHGIGEYRGALKAEAIKRAANELRSRGWSEQQLSQPFVAGAETPASMLIRAPDKAAPFIVNGTTSAIAPKAPQQARESAGEPPAPPPEAGAEPGGAVPRGIEQTAQEAGVKYDGPMEIPGGAHQFTDQRTNSTFIVRGEFTPEKFADKLGQLRERYKPKPAVVPDEIPVVENLGPGAANAKEFAKRPRIQIAAYNDAVDAQRSQRGLPPLMSEVRASDPEKWDAAQDAIERDPDMPARVVRGINEGTKKSVSSEEQLALLWRMTDLQNRKEMELERATHPDNTPAEQEAAKAEYEALEKELLDTESANRKAGSQSSDALRIRQLIANSDYTYAGMLRRRELAKGSPLTTEERATIKKQSEDIQRTQRELDLRTEELQAGKPVDEAIRLIEAEAAKNPEFTPEVRSLADRIVSRLDTAASAALKRLRAKFAQTNVGVDPTILADVAIYGASKIAKGLVKFGQWSASMIQDFGEGVKPYLADAWKSASARLDEEIGLVPAKQRQQVGEAVKKAKASATVDSIGEQMKARIADGDKLTDLRGYVQRLIETVVRSGVKGREAVTDAVQGVLRGIDPKITRRQTMDLMSGYGDFKPLNTDAIKAEVRDIRGQLQQVAKLEDIQAKQPLQKTGVERRVPSTEERALIQQVNEAKKKFGVVVTDPAAQLKSATDAIETRLSNQIKDLTREIETGEGRPAKGPAPTNERIESLKALRDRVQETLDSVRGKREMTQEQRAESVKRGLQKQVEVLENQIRTGEKAHKSTATTVRNAEIDALRARKDALRAEIEELDANNLALQDERRFDALMKQADALEQRLAEGDPNREGPKQDRPESEIVSLARQRLDAVQKQMVELRKAKHPPKSEEQKRLESLERTEKELQERIAKGDISTRAKTQGPDTKLVSEAKSRIADLQKEIKELRKAANPPKPEEIRKLEAAFKSVDKSIAEYDRRIQAGDISAKARKPGVSSTELEARRAERDAMRDFLSQMRRDAMPKITAEERAIKALKTRLTKDTADRLDRLARADFSPRAKKPPVDISKDTEAVRLKAENERAKREFEQAKIKDEYRRSSLAQKAWRFTRESLNLPRAILSSWDLSAVLRQGGLISLGNPVRAARAIKEMFVGLASQRRAEEMDAAIRMRSNAKMYEDSGLYLAPLDEVRISRQEEQIMSELANKIPGIKASNRAFVTFLNRLRADSFDSMAASLAKNGVKLTPEEATAIANYVNVATGRGNLGQASQAATTLATVFFSPRLLASRFQYLTRPLLGFRQGAPTSARVRRAVAWEYGKLISGLGVVYGLAQLMGAKVEKDPRSSDFGKMVIGNTRIDPLAGLAQVTTFLGRVATGQTKTAKGIKPLRGDDMKYGADDTFDIATRFLRTKFSPVLGAAVDISSGQNVVGQKVTPGETLKNLVIPLGFRDVQAVMKEQGVPKGLAIELLNLFGWGVQNYGK